MVIQGNDSPAAVVWNPRGLYQAVGTFSLLLGKLAQKTCQDRCHVQGRARGERWSGAGGWGPGLWTKPAEAAVDEAATTGCVCMRFQKMMKGGESGG